MNRERLEHLITILESDMVNKPGKFDLDKWATTYDDVLYYRYDLSEEERQNILSLQEEFKASGQPQYVRTNERLVVRTEYSDSEYDYEKIVPYSCGTVCCAVGWACLDKKFNEEGLCLALRAIALMNGLNFKQAEPFYNNKSSFNAVMDFFEISEFIADDLFLASHYKDEDTRNPKAVAERIRNYLTIDNYEDIRKKEYRNSF